MLEAQRNKVVGVEEARTFDCTSGARTMSVTSYQLPVLDTNFLPVFGAMFEPITTTCYTRTSLTRDSQEYSCEGPRRVSPSSATSSGMRLPLSLYVFRGKLS